MRAEIWVGPERRRRWSAGEKVRIVREAFAPGARVSDVARRRDVSRAQVYQWSAELRDGRLSDGGADMVGVVPMDVTGSAALEPPAPSVIAADRMIEISLAGGRSLKVLSSLPMAELRHLIRAVEEA